MKTVKNEKRCPTKMQSFSQKNDARQKCSLFLSLYFRLNQSNKFCFSLIEEL